jgi:predicted GTPase
MSGRKRVLILGAAGRDFHDFNVIFRGHQEYDVVAFSRSRTSMTAAIPHRSRAKRCTPAASRSTLNPAWRS